MNITKPFRGWWLVVFCGMLLYLSTFVFHPFEPRYQGKRLSVWVANLPPKDLHRDEVVMTDALIKTDDENAAAFRYFGVSAIPVALGLCRASDSKFREKLGDWNDDWNRAHESFQIHLFDEDAEGLAHVRSRQIFRILGPVGAPAIPELIKLLADKNENVADTAASDLSAIGTNAIPPLIVALADHDPQRRRFAAITLGSFGTNAAAALPGLLRCLKDDDYQARDYAARVLVDVGADAATAMPALIEVLKRQNSNSYSGVLSALGKYGTNAQAAVPLLIHLIQTQPKPSWANPALKCLQKIDPEAALLMNQTR